MPYVPWRKDFLRMSKWPKQLPLLTKEQKEIHDDFMKYWHEKILPNRYQIIEQFNHGFPVKNCREGGRVLEIGAGVGEHISYENLARTEYYALEMRQEMAQLIRERFPSVNVVVGDCQKSINFQDDFFDKVLAIHVLEHLPNLPSALKEIHRVLKPNGEFCVVIPCEGGLAHRSARNISVKPIFQKRYGISHELYTKCEHVNTAKEVIEELKIYFKTDKSSFFPLKIPLISINLAIGMVLKPQQKDYTKQLHL